MNTDDGEMTQHAAVMPDEVLAGWLSDVNGFYVDGTFGRGGHSRLLLERLAPRGRLLAIDRDPEAIASAAQLQQHYSNLLVEQAEYSQMSSLVRRHHELGSVSGILLDLGVSSPQLDAASRGFSFMRDGPLDMRMDPTVGESAANWLQRAEVKEIANVLRRYGEEKFAMRIAQAIDDCRSRGELIDRTGKLVDIIAGAVPARDQGKHKATRTFQALRIFINRELEHLENFLEDCIAMLAPGGRLAIISFHSLEDRIVKRFIRSQAKGDEMPSKLPVRDAELNRKLKIIVRAQKASVEEVAKNPRSRSAVLRVAEKLP